MVFYTMTGRFPTFQELKNNGIAYRGTFVEATYEDAMAAMDTPQVCFEVMGFDVAMNNICWRYDRSMIDSIQKVWHCRREQVPGTTIEDKFIPIYCRTTSPAL